MKIIEKKQGHFQCKNQCCKGRDYNVSFCDTKEISVGEDILTFFQANKKKKMLLLDGGAPVNNTGKPLLEGYTEEYGIDINHLKRISCH